MRNLTKVLALVLALTMMVSVAAFAASYTDVEAGSNYEEAVSVLSDLGLVKGYEDGTFGAEKTLTRAEAATFVIRLVGLEDAAISAAGSDTGFTDVAADHWASGYIYMAVQRGIVAGMGDGTFDPEAELEFAQIVKMLVVALGYEPQAAELGEWPGNYISTASNIGLTKGISGKATDKVTRATTARLIYAALTIPKMEKNGVGVNAVFEPVDKMILDELGIYKLSGKVLSVDGTNDTVTLDLEDWAVIANKKYKEVEVDDEDYEYDGSSTVKVGNLASTLKEMTGVPAYIYVTEIDDDETVVAIVEKKNVSSVQFTPDDYDEHSGSKLTIYTDADQTKTKKINLAETVEVYVNGAAADSEMAAEDFIETYVEMPSGAYMIDLKDTVGKDEKYDYANITEFNFMVVEEIKSTKAGLYTVTSEDLEIMAGELPRFRYDTEEADDADVTFIKDGETVEISAIEEGNILNLVIEEDGIDSSDYLTKATVYITNEKVDGTVRYHKDDTITLSDGSKYKSMLSTELASQYEGTLYVNMAGKVIYTDDEGVKSTYSYGFATNLTLTGRTTMNQGTVRILTTEGEWVTLDLKNKFDTNENTVTIDEVTSAEFATVKTDLNARGLDDTEVKEPIFIINNVVEYKLDSAGAVKEINVIEATSSSKKFYDDETEPTLGGYVVDETTVVFSIIDDAEIEQYDFDESDVKVSDISVLTDKKEYTGVTFANLDSDDTFAGVIAGVFATDVDFLASFFVVSDVYGEILTEMDDMEVTTVVGFQDGEEKTYYISDDADESEVFDIAISAEDKADDEIDALKPISKGDAYADDIVEGDILLVTADADGVASKVVVLAKVTDYADEAEFTFTDAIDRWLVEDEDNERFVYGFVADKSGSSIYLDIDDTNVENKEYKTSEDGVARKYNISNAKVTVFDFDKKEGKRVSDGTASDISKGTYVFALSDENNKLVEAVVIINEQANNY